ncbi:glycosyltransferase family 2 protein [Specibacter sp. RAF43]|uniref:glycosyltransferase family 2 protein n=1 Tax=Specibacter sp. RAF43 TaxID=3233057 RepID=UPI003F9AFA66
MSGTAHLSERLHSFVDDHAISGGVAAIAAFLARSTFKPTTSVPARRAALSPSRRATVSVVIPCYNYGHFLRGAVASALNQPDVDVQVIIVNDRSPDDTAAIADSLAASDSRVEVVHNDVNLGHVAAFNRGLRRVTGEFLVRLDADDLLTPGSLARAVALFDAFAEVGLIYGNPRHFTTPQPPPGRVGRVSWSVWSGATWLAERCRQGVNCITTPEAILRMSVVDRVGPLDTRLRFAQDMEMWCRVAAVSDVARINSVDQALHRDHAASMSANEGSPFDVDLAERRLVFDAVFSGVGAALPNASSLRAQAHESLDREARRQRSPRLRRVARRLGNELAYVRWSVSGI